MITIEELLTPGERVIKKHTATLEKGAACMLVGYLYLTNTRLLFIPKKRWALALSTAAPSLIGLRIVQVPLQSIKTVKKSWGRLKAQADKEYTYH
ncbi:MAG: GRAM domain-containing protein [Candidatus Bathyarchaeota archaeon]|nr:GRAM domain-containing protein [Candidatus Bathyarchaeota archaeon]MDH5746249.1 GRAM domain-containing protein [Candidatus Bathyarchaeota archaeon]